MTDFAKLFSVDGRQVLVFVAPGDTKDFVLNQMTYSPKFGATITVTVAFNVAESVTDPYEMVLSRYGETNARAFVEETVWPLERGAAA